MFNFLTSKKEKAQIFSIPQLVITNKGVLDIDKIKKGYGIVGNNDAVNYVEKVEKTIKKGTFYLINKSVLLYEDQSIMLGERAIHARLLKRNDELTMRDGSKVKIATIKKVRGNYYFHRLTISGDHTYYINDVLVHNASRYWVGGTASWDATAGTKWSATSGGAGGASVPTTSDDVFFNAASGAVTCTLSGNRSCHHLNFTGFTGTFAWSTGIMNCEGDLTLVAAMTLTAAGGFIQFLHATVLMNITTNGKTVPFEVYAEGNGGIKLLDTFVATANINVDVGNFDANNQNVTAPGVILATGAFGCSLTMGSGTWTITGSGNAWNVATSGGITITPNTSTIKFTDSTNADLSFIGGGKTYNNVWFARGASTGQNFVTGANTYADLKDSGTVAHTLSFETAVTQTFTTFTVSGSAGQLISINSNDGAGGASTGTHTLSKSGGGTISCDYLNIQHSIGSPASTWYAGTHSTNNQGVATAGSGWIFSAPVVGGNGNFLPFFY